jgi:cobyrinic acid a,c-diamide synthase
MTTMTQAAAEQDLHPGKSDTPRGVTVAGLGGGSGKSVVAVGLAAALARRGRLVRCFKKGPDYIDAGWLEMAAGRSCCNLDPFLMAEDALRHSFLKHCHGMERVVVEGNRGLFDGVNVEGAFSTAELTKSLDLPILLVVDCTKTTRTVAALVLGCREFDREVKIAGVVLNRVGTTRHENLVREAVEHYTGIPVVGAIHRRKGDFFPQRHLGVTPAPEHDRAAATVADLADLAEASLDLDRIEALMSAIPEAKYEAAPAPALEIIGTPLRIGVVRDAAFQFYYPENLEALRAQGAALVEVNALRDRELPPLDALYIGGGFPETSIKELSANLSFREALRAAATSGLPIYAECGGLIYLGESMEINGKDYPLAGVFPVRFDLKQRPQAHGYTILRVEGDNPFYQKGTEIKGHEFRYSSPVSWPAQPEELVMRMERGVGFMAGRDGLVTNNVLALYTHVHAVGTPSWAAALAGAAHRHATAAART